MGTALQLSIHTQGFLSLSKRTPERPETPYPTKTPCLGTVAVNGGLLSSQKASLTVSSMQKTSRFFCGCGQGFFSACISVGGVCFEKYLCPLLGKWTNNHSGALRADGVPTLISSKDSQEENILNFKPIPLILCKCSSFRVRKQKKPQSGSEPRQVSSVKTSLLAPSQLRDLSPGSESWYQNPETSSYPGQGWSQGWRASLSSLTYLWPWGEGATRDMLCQGRVGRGACNLASRSSGWSWGGDSWNSKDLARLGQLLPCQWHSGHKEGDRPSVPTTRGLVPEQGAGSEQETAEEAPGVAFLIRTCETERDCYKLSTTRHFNQAC